MKTTQILLYLSLVFLVFGSSSGYENVMSRMDWIGDAKDPKKWLLFVGKCLTQAATGLSRKFQSNYFAFLQFLLKKGKIFKMKAGQVLLKTELVRNPTSVILEDTRNKFIMRWTVDVSPWFRVNLTVKTLNAREMFGSCLDGRLALLQLSVKPIQHDFCGIHSGFTFYTQSSFVLLKLISKRQKVKLHMLISVFSKGLISNQFVKKATANECESLFLHYILTPKTFVHTFRVQLKRIFLLSIHLIKNSNGTFIVFDGPGILSDKHSLVKNFHSSSFQCLMQLFFAPAHKTDRLFLGLKFSKRFSHIRKILDDTESIQSFSSKNWTCDSPESSILELHAKTQYRVNITLKKFIFDGKPSTNCQYGGVTVYFDKNMTSSEHFCDKVEAGKTTGWTYTWSLLSDHNTLICIHYAYERYSKIETVLQVSATDCHVKRIKVCREGYLRYPKSLIGYERLETDRIARPNGCVVFQVDSGILYPHKQNIKLREKHGRYSIKKVTSVCFLYFHLSSKYPKVETWSLVLSGFFDGNQPGRTLLYIPPGDPRLLHKGRYLLTKYWDSRSSHTTAIKKSTSSIRSQVVDLSFFLEFFFITSTGMESVLLNLMLRFYLWADSWLNILLRPSNHSFVTPKTKPWLLNAMTGNMSTVRRPSHVNAIDGLVIELPSAQSSSGDNAVSCNIEGVSHNSDFDSTYLKMKHYKLHKLVTRLVLVFKLDFSKYEICCHHQPLTPTTTPLTIHWTNESFPLQREVDIFKKYLRKENVKKEYNEVNIFCNINITLVDPFPLWYIYTHKPLLSSFNWRAAFANKTLFSWNDAQQYCHQHGMQLLTVFSFQKLTCVLFWLKVSSDLLSVDAIFLDLRFNERQVRLCP